MFYPFGGNQLLGDLLDSVRAPSNDQDFQAIVMVEVDVEARNDDIVVVMLNVRQRGLDAGLMMVVNKRDGAGDLT